MTTKVTDVAPADPAAAAEHFESALRFETDCSYVREALRAGRADFVLLDVRSLQSYAEGHVPGALSLPHARIDDDALRGHPRDRLFVVYCAGPHCNGAHRAAIRLARLGRPVKIMIGGVAGWLDEGFELESEPAPPGV